MDPSDEPAGVYACNCAKDERKRLAVRRYAGVFVTVLPCGHIVTVQHLLGSESLPQVAFSFSRALDALPDKTVLCYDNACALARFCRNPSIRANISPATRRLRDCTFILPESHARGHTACLDPTSTYYLPEVRKRNHPALAGVNCEAQEHVFSWVRWLVFVANPMAPVRHRTFFLLLCIARNTHRQPPTLRRRRTRPWKVWPGVRRLQIAQPATSSASQHPDPVPAPPEPWGEAMRYLQNLRDNKLHRAAGAASLCCGATLPKRFRFLASRSEAGRHKLCLRPGCFFA